MATKFSKVINERSTAVYSSTLKDENGQVIPAASLGTLTLTLFEAASGTILNTRNAQNVLNQNNVTVDANGVLTYVLQPADTAILNPGLHTETHRALFEFTWNSGARTHRHVVDFEIENLDKVS